MSAGKPNIPRGGVIRGGDEVIWAVEGATRAGLILMPHHLLTNFETQKYYQNEPKFNGVYSRDKLPKIYDGAYAANFDEYELLETHWKTVYVNGANVTHSDSFGVEHISKQLNKKNHRQQKYKYL